jgi:hypothetical protein
VDWPKSTAAAKVVGGVFADELIATERYLVWVTHSEGSTWVFDLATNRTTEALRRQRKPHDLGVSRDGRTIFWHEGEADLLPGRTARAFEMDSTTLEVRDVTDASDPSEPGLLDGACAYGPGQVKRRGPGPWHTIGGGAGRSPMADDDERWFWLEDTPDGPHIVSARKDACCPRGPAPAGATR